MLLLRMLLDSVVRIELTKDSFSVFVNKRLKAKFASNFSTDHSRLQDAYAIQVVKGDVIYIPNIYSRVMLLPFVYNGE